MLPKYAVIGVHQAGAGTGLRASSVSWCSAGAHSRGGAGPGTRPATTSEVRASSELRRQCASFDLGKRRGFTKSPYFGQGYHAPWRFAGRYRDHEPIGAAHKIT